MTIQLHMSAHPPIPEGRASRVMMANYHPDDWRLWRKWMLDQGMPTAPNREQRRAQRRLVARRHART